MQARQLFHFFLTRMKLVTWHVALSYTVLNIDERYDSCLNHSKKQLQALRHMPHLAVPTSSPSTTWLSLHLVRYKAQQA